MPRKALVSTVLTAAEQARLTPDEVLQSLKEGNSRFVNNDITARDHTAQVRMAAAGQYPKAMVLSCLDSRVPVEDVFDKGIGDLFVGRVAGNFVNEDLLGSMEFACHVAGAKLIVVLGHEYCGAVKAAIDNVKLGNITAMLSKLRPIVRRSAQTFRGKKLSTNPAYVDHVAKNNVKHNVKLITRRSPLLRDMVKAGELKIIGGYYDLDTAVVEFFE
ncbi:MAG: carbonic anhydrase [Pirellulaceae bacterium]|nr:carbonic anhydrase [Pirellulaceae bacterium]